MSVGKTMEMTSGPTSPPGLEAPFVGPFVGPRAGDRIGAYRLIRLIGHGSTGQVFEAEHERLGRRAALKILHPDQAVRPDSVRRLLREGLAVNRINHPHIVEVTDYVELQSPPTVSTPEAGAAPGITASAERQPWPYAIVMELLEGESLSELMSREDPLPPERFLPILAQVCWALAAAHDAGFVHRDLKPDNIFLIRRGENREFVKLLDFGLAKRVSVDDSIATQLGLSTHDGAFLGTPAYVSPEQAAGRGVDHRTDIYSVGVILYELMSGKLPFSGDSLGDFLLQHLTQPPAPLPEAVAGTPLGRTLAAVSYRCMAKDPAARFSSASGLAELFENLAAGQSVQFTSMRIYAWPALRRTLSRRAATLAAGLAAGVVLWLGFDWTRGRHAGDLRAADKAAAPTRGTPTRPGTDAQAKTPEGAKKVAAASPVAPSALAETAETLEETQGASATGTPAARVTLTFQSAPEGAVVRRKADGQLIGITPFRQSFAVASQPVDLEVRLAGHRTAMLHVTPDRPQIVEVNLERAAGPGRRRAMGAPQDGTGEEQAVDHSAKTTTPQLRDRDSTLNPFAWPQR